MRRRIGAMVLVLSWGVNVLGSTVVEVSGRVVGRAGTPVAGVRVSESWFAEQSAPLEPNGAVRTDADGRFSLEARLYGRGTVVMAIDPTGGLGGLAIISAEAPRD